MSMQDPISDMLTIIRNGQHAKLEVVSMRSSKLKVLITKVLKEEGYIEDYSVDSCQNGIKKLSIVLKYFNGRPVIEKIRRISRPGLRSYVAASDIKPVGGFGIRILSTSQGVMTNVLAKKTGIGGEVICEVA